ncbi:MAG: hypothetical protein EOO38_05760 [Cytophagaceae bacterium]|nr:MAG: hypothetical protein EOO38_05760 [Cytophagaceae bacterium]
MQHVCAMPDSSPFTTRINRNPNWGALQRASCEVICRCITERGYDITGRGLTKGSPHLDEHIRRTVEAVEERGLSKMLMDDLQRHGLLASGWNLRWREPPRRAQDSLPEMPSDISDSSDAFQSTS